MDEMIMTRFFYRLSYILIALFLSTNLVFADPPLPTPVGRVIWIKGTLKATMDNKEERTLQVMSVIYAHDILVTDKTSQAQIAFTDNSLMTFRPETKFSINEYINATSNKKSGVSKFVVNLLEGGFRTVTGLISKQSPKNYQVNTPVATIGVRGTDYSVVVQDNKTYIKQISGTPSITSGGKTVYLSDGHKYAVVNSGNTPPTEPTVVPNVFKGEDLKIEKVTIKPFGITTSNDGSSNGPISSFCISQ